MMSPYRTPAPRTEEKGPRWGATWLVKMLFPLLHPGRWRIRALEKRLRKTRAMQVELCAATMQLERMFAYDKPLGHRIRCQCGEHNDLLVVAHRDR